MLYQLKFYLQTNRFKMFFFPYYLFANLLFEYCYNTIQSNQEEDKCPKK